MGISIKARLLMWMFGGMALLLAVFALVVYGIMARSLMNSFDEVLVSSARVIMGSIERGKDTIRVDIDEIEMPQFHRLERPEYFQLWSAYGQVLARSPSIKDADLERFEGPHGLPVLQPVRLPDGRPGRAVSVLFEPDFDDGVKEAAVPQRLTLVVARETTALDSEIRFLKWLLAATAGGTIILALLVGAVVVGQGLRPLDDLASRIAGIRQDDLSTTLASDRIPAEIAPVVQRLNDLLRRLEEAFRREKAFTADAAHELRTPLAGMRSTLEVSLARPRAADDYRQDMRECLDIVRRMQAMVDNLLALARLEGGRATHRFETIPLLEQIERAIGPLSDKARKRGITVECRVPANLACTADRDTLALILSSLLANAVEYADDGGRITATAHASAAYVILTVSNTGCRLSEEEVQHVFERFWRADAARADTGVHCGLGLALAQRAAISLGGNLSARVSDGTFAVDFTLPAATPSLEGRRASEEAHGAN